MLTKQRIVPISLALLLGACTALPHDSAHKACELLQTAADEAVMAPAWHLQAGEVLQACGQPVARAAAEARACYASARDGHRDRAECDAL